VVNGAPQDSKVVALRRKRELASSLFGFLLCFHHQGLKPMFERGDVEMAEIGLAQAGQSIMEMEAP
jgi:hypothetical protein